jgi:hypothetical protein
LTIHHGRNKYRIGTTSRTSPLVIYLVNAGNSMGESLGIFAKIAHVNKLIENEFASMMERSTFGEVVRSHYRLSMIAYQSIPVDLFPGILTIAQLKRLGRPELVASGPANAAAAFEMARDILEAELPMLAGHPVPLVCHITDGVFSGPDPEPIAHEIMRMSTDDGNVLVQNIFVGEISRATSFGDIRCWPGFSDHGELTDSSVVKLYHMSSPLPSSYSHVVQQDGYALGPGARMLFPITAAPLVELIFLARGPGGRLELGQAGAQESAPGKAGRPEGEPGSGEDRGGPDTTGDAILGTHATAADARRAQEENPGQASTAGPELPAHVEVRELDKATIEMEGAASLDAQVRIGSQPDNVERLPYGSWNNYQIEATSRAPALVIYLVNVGSSMAESLGIFPKIEHVNRLIEETLIGMVRQSIRGEAVAPFYRVGMFAYNSDPIDVFPGVLTIDLIAQRGRPVLTAAGSSNAAAAFELARDMLEAELPRLAGHPVPLNILALVGDHRNLAT